MGERAGPSKPPATFEGPTSQTLGPMLLLTSALTSAHVPARGTAGGSGLPASWGLTLTLGRYTRGPPKGPGNATWGLGTPEPQHRTQHATPPPPWLLGAQLVIQGRRTGRALRAPSDIRRPLAPKRLGPCSSSPAPSPRPPLCTTHSWLIGAAGLLGANSKPYIGPRGAPPRGLVPPCWGLGNPEPKLRTHPAAPPPPWPLGCRWSLRAGERAGPSELTATIEGPPRQNSWAHVPASSAFTSARPSARRTAGRSGLPASSGLTLTLGQLTRGPSQGAPPKWPVATTPGIGDPRAAAPDSP